MNDENAYAMKLILPNKFDSENPTQNFANILRVIVEIKHAKKPITLSKTSEI